MKKITIYICGNPLLEIDNLPLKLKPKLEPLFPEINFRFLDPNENIKPQNKELIIIDTVINITKVEKITDVNKIQNSPGYSAHDFDLGINLKLLTKLGLLKRLTIIAVPPNIKLPDALRQVTVKIQNYINGLTTN